jgi:DNA-binding GntR family transcriptional regulator
MLANMEFRAAWIGALPNARLRDVIESFSDHVQAVRIATLREPRIQAVVTAGVDRLYAGFAAGDGAATHDAMVDFMAAAEAEYFRAVGAAP